MSNSAAQASASVLCSSSSTVDLLCGQQPVSNSWLLFVSGGSIYSGTKHFIKAFTNSARHDLVGTDIRVTAISPGAVQTEFSKVRYSGDEDKAAAVYDGIIPLNAADVADNVLYAATRYEAHAIKVASFRQDFCARLNLQAHGQSKMSCAGYQYTSGVHACKELCT